tara:strand:- start:825 stop:1040 length:216 start_codon:yes stop_codon:yes gene_type:complete
MKQETIKFTIRQDGYVTEEVIGAESNQCLNLTESIERKLGNVTTRSYKSEFYESVKNEQNIEEWSHDSEGC